MEQPFMFLFSQPQSEIRLRDNENDRIISAQISENQKFLATQHFHSRKRIKLWDLKNKKKIKDIELMSTVFITLFEFSCDSQIFFYAEYDASELNMVYLNNKDLVQKSINILGKINKVIFNQNNTSAVILHNDNNIFSIWKIIEQQKELQVKIQYEVINSLFLDMKKFLIISVEEEEFTNFLIYSSDQQKIINQWKARYISKNIKLHFNSNNQLLIIDFRDEYEHYIQIWSLYNFILIKHLYDQISSFDIKGIQGIQFVAVIEDESDDESDEENDIYDENSYGKDNSQLQNNCVTVGIYNLFTGKINKGLTNIQNQNQFSIFNKIVMEYQILDQNTKEIILSFY